MSPDERQRNAKPRVTAESAVRAGSLLIAACVLALVVWDPRLAGSHGSMVERAFGAAMIVGAVSSAMRGLGLRGTRRHVRIATHPAVCWTLSALGATGRLFI